MVSKCSEGDLEQWQKNTEYDLKDRCEDISSSNKIPLQERSKLIKRKQR